MGFNSGFKGLIYIGVWLIYIGVWLIYIGVWLIYIGVWLICIGVWLIWWCGCICYEVQVGKKILCVYI